MSFKLPYFYLLLCDKLELIFPFYKWFSIKRTNLFRHTWLFFVRLVVFRPVNLVKTPSRVSIPSERGVTSWSQLPLHDCNTWVSSTQVNTDDVITSTLRAESKRRKLQNRNKVQIFALAKIDTKINTWMPLKSFSSYDQDKNRWVDSDHVITSKISSVYR